MKLKEPLQVLKQIQGHIVWHVAIFIVGWRIDTTNFMEINEDQGRQRLAFNLLRWGHFSSVILQSMAWGLKKKTRNVTVKMISIVNIFTYVTPCIHNQWVCQLKGANADGHNSSVYQFLFLESLIFIMQQNFTVLFLLQSYICKRRSMIRDQEGMMSKDKNFLKINVWNNRKAADYMLYIKNEFLNA